MTPFIEFISIKDLLNDFLKLCDLTMLGQMTICSKDTLFILSNDQIWETLYRKHLKAVPHLDMTVSWLKSFSFNYSLLNQVSTSLIREFCLITDSRFINTSLMKRELFRIIVSFMTKSDYTVKKSEFNKFYTSIHRTLVFLNGTKNAKFKIAMTRDVIQLKQTLTRLLTVFEFDLRRV